MPKVSIIVPVYNSEKYLERCIESLINQTLKDIEIILVNDASPDNSKEIMERYAHKDERIVTIYNKENDNPNPRNAGIRAAKSNYLGFVDADDWVEETMYEEMYNATNGETVDVVVGGYYWYYSNDNMVYDTNIKNSAFATSGDVKNEVGIHGGRLMMNLWRRSLITENDFYFMPHNTYCDSVVFLWYVKAQSFVKLDKPYYYYRINPVSVTARKDYMGFFDRMASADNMFERGVNAGLYKDNTDAFEAAYYRLFLRNTLIGSVKNFTVLPKKQIYECIAHYNDRHSINNVRLLQGNRSPYDRVVSLMVVYPKIGAVIMRILLMLSTVKHRIK